MARPRARRWTLVLLTALAALLPAASGLAAPRGGALEEAIMRRLVSWFKTSPAVAAKHQEHIAGETPLHLMKGSPLTRAPDALKLQFIDSAAGKFVESFMRFERSEAGDWKVAQVLEAAGPDYDAEAALAVVSGILEADGVVMFSFVDCPWCVAAKKLLREELAALGLGAERLRVVELDDDAANGKAIRAALAQHTGRTSMPNVFVGGKSLGGYTDGEPSGSLAAPDSPGVRALRDSGRLREMLRRACGAAPRGG